MRHHLHIHAGSREKLSTLGLYNKSHIDVSFPLKGRVYPLSSSRAIGRSGLENARQDWVSSQWLGQWGGSFKHPNRKAQKVCPESHSQCLCQTPLLFFARGSELTISVLELSSCFFVGIAGSASVLSPSQSHPRGRRTLKACGT